MARRPLTVAWISFFPLEWLPDVPEEIIRLPRQHPAPWQRILADELQKVPEVNLYIISVRKEFKRTLAFERKGVTYHCLKVPGGMRTFSLFWYETLMIKRCFRKIRPDLVHAWGSERAAALVASRLSYPYLVTMQGLMEWIAQYVKFNRFEQVALRLEKPALQRASFVTAESDFAVKWLQERYPHLKVLQVEHSPDWLFHRLERQPQTKPAQLLYVGSLSLLKGVDLLFRALDQLTSELDFRLTIVSAPHPELAQKMKDEVSQKCWDRISFRENLSPQQIGEEMARATLLLYPTRVDNSPNAVKEAVVAGVPVIASAVGGIPDYVWEGKNGATFPAQDLNLFVAAIRTALGHPLFGQGKVEPHALKSARRYLSPAVMRDKFLAAYDAVLESQALG